MVNVVRKLEVADQELDFPLTEALQSRLEITDLDQFFEDQQDQLIFEEVDEDLPSESILEQALITPVEIVKPYLPSLQPQPLTYWQGRDRELAELRTALEHKHTSFIGITGSAGYGKSDLGIKLYQEMTQFTYRFWVDLSSGQTFGEFAQAAIAQTSQIPDYREQNLISELVKLFQIQPCLLIIDHIDNLTTIKWQWLKFFDLLHQALERSAIIPSKIVAIARQLDSFPAQTNVVLDHGLSTPEAIALLETMGIVGDQEDLEAFTQLVGGQPLALTLAARLLVTEETNPQIRYLSRYGNIFDLSYDLKSRGNRQISPQIVFTQSFNRLLPKQQLILTSASIYPRPFSLPAIQGLGLEAEISDLDQLVKLGLLDQCDRHYFYFRPQIRELIQPKLAEPDLKILHEKAINYYWTKVKPQTQWRSALDVSEYLAIFYHCCQLGEHYRAFYIIRDDLYSDDCVDKFLDTVGNHSLRISLYQPLAQAWQEIQSERWELGAALTALGNAYFSLGEYTECLQFYRQWLEITQKNNEGSTDKYASEAKCLSSLGNAYQAMGQVKQALNYHQHSLEIARKISDRPTQINALAGLGHGYQSLNEYAQAIEYFQQLLELASAEGDLQAEANALGNLGNAYKNLKQYNRAIHFYQKHLELIQDLIFSNDSASQNASQNHSLKTSKANSLSNLAHAYQVLGQYPQALESYQSCLELTRELTGELTGAVGSDRSQEAICLNGLGIAADGLGKYNEAVSYDLEALEIFKELGDRTAEATALNHLANAYNSLGQYVPAIKSYEESLKISMAIGDRSQQAKSLTGLGNASHASGQNVKAIQFYNQALVITEKIGDRRATAMALGSIGNVYNSFGQYPEALQFYQQSLEIAREVGDRLQQANCLSGLGHVLDGMGQFNQAIAYHQQWLEIKRELGDAQSASTTTLDNKALANTATNALANTKYAQAIEFHQQWIEVKRKMGDRQGEANSLGNLGNAFFALGQYPQAIQAYQQCLEIARRLGDRRGEANSLTGLGNAFFTLGQYAQSIEFHQRSLEISQKIDALAIQANSFNNLGKAYYSLGQYSQAAQKHKQCLDLMVKIGNRRGEASALGDLGNTHYALGKYPQAIDFYQQWLKISQEIGDRSQQGNALGGLGNAHNALGQYAKAVEFYSQWLQISRELGDRRSEANALGGLGNAYNTLGEYNRAMEFHQQSLGIQREISDRLSETGTWSNFVEALAILEQKPSNNPYKSINSDTNLPEHDNAIQQLMDASLRQEPIAKPKSKPITKQVSPKKGWLGSTIDWITKRKNKK